MARSLKVIGAILTLFTASTSGGCATNDNNSFGVLLLFSVGEI